LDVCLAIPERGAAILASCSIKRLNIVYEPRLALNARQKLIVQSGAKFLNAREINLAGNNSRVHSVPPDR
jgi:hypothetical protein